MKLTFNLLQCFHSPTFFLQNTLNTHKSSLRSRQSRKHPGCTVQTYALMPRLERYSHPNKIWFNLRKIYNSKFVHFQAFVICTVDLRENIFISAGWLASPPTKQLMLLIYCYSHACRFQTVHCHKVYWIPSKNFAKIHLYGKLCSSPVDTRRTQWKHRLTSLAELVASLHLSLKATVIFNILGEGIPLKGDMQRFFTKLMKSSF